MTALKKSMMKDEGAVVIEAGISLPVFMFLIVTILTLVNICIAQSRIQVALNETAKEISEYSYFYSLTGINDIQAINNEAEETVTTKENLDGVLAGLTSVYDGIGSIYGAGEDIINSTNNGKLPSGEDFDSAIEKVDSGTTEISEGVDGIGEAVKAMADDPKTFMIGVVRIAANEVAEAVKSQIIGIITKGFIKKNLTETGSKQDVDVDAYLKHLGIKEGMDGISFTNSSFFKDGTDDIVLVAEYKIHVIRLLNVDIELNFVQSAPTKAWKAAEKTVVSSTKLVTDGKKEIEYPKIVIENTHQYTLNCAAEAWTVPTTLDRGGVIETLLAESEYADWWNCKTEGGAEYQYVDFQRGNDVVSLNTLDPNAARNAGNEINKNIIKCIDDLYDAEIEIDGTPANKIVDIRVPQGTIGRVDVAELKRYAEEKNIVIIIKEF